MHKQLVTPWHESFAFGKEARAKIPRRVLDRILELNTLDTQLWELGEKLLTVHAGAMGPGPMLGVGPDYWVGHGASQQVLPGLASRAGHAACSMDKALR